MADRNYPEWMHEAVAELTGIKNARVICADGNKVEFEARVGLHIAGRHNIRRIARIQNG